MPKTLTPQPSLFSQNDCDFLLSSLRKKGRGTKRLLKLLENPAKRYDLLSEESVLKAICEKAEANALSLYLYYGSQIAYGLRAAGLTDPDLMASLNTSISQVAEGLSFKAKTVYRASYLPLMLMVAIKKRSKGYRHFQIVGDLKKACIVIDGSFREPKADRRSSV